ncbi:cytochrome P450 [Streptomyces sp. NPDC000410]|uniref:cytochrome P450 n=1 Tax=Streptomyces sp. NPDC000410 TaxID=3154254 RepID=UPI00332CC0B4
MSNPEVNTGFPFDPADPEFRRDPYPVYRKLRDDHPVLRGPLGAWVVSRYKDTEVLLRDRRLGKDLSSTQFFAQAAGAEGEEPPPFLGLGMDGWDSNLFKLLDPPEHTRLRNLVAAPFTPSAVENLIKSVTVVVDELLDELPERFDVMDLLAMPLPVRVLGDMMGIPREDQELFTAWSSEIARILELGAEPPQDLAEACQKAVAQCTEYFVKVLQEREQGDGDDLISKLARSPKEIADDLTVHQIAAVCVLLIVPGLDTFSNLIGNAVALLAEHPEALTRLAEDPALADDVVDEVLRLEPPTHASWRVATEPIELHGETIQPGDVVLLMLAAANRDERVFPDPDSFTLGAHGRKHLSFGRGIHYCLGDNLSKLMAKEALIGLAKRAATLTLEDDEVALKPGIWLRGPSRLPVVVERRAG